jgi:hypothetical protein
MASRHETRLGPVAREEAAWVDGSVRLRASAYPFAVALPRELVVWSAAACASPTPSPSHGMSLDLGG